MINSRIKLNRFLVFNETKSIYDQAFHDGINVIRGEHSVGKSTLFDLIYYVLGGELKEEEWKYPINKCTEVRAEIEVNNKTITLAREISVGGKPKIKIFDGDYEKAAKDSENWLYFGPVRSGYKASFSEVMFDLLGWGQQKTELFSNLTMHQILRLSYLGQSSKSTNIFREEIDKRGDSGSTRKAIAEFLFGLDDLSSYDKRQNKLQKEFEMARFQSRLDNARRVIGQDSTITIKDIEILVTEKESQIINLIDEKGSRLQNACSETSSAITNKRNQILADISTSSDLISSLSNEIVYNQREMEDCALFSKSLDLRIKSLGESEKTYQSLGNISFNYCPACFGQLAEIVVDHQCALCKNPIESDLSEKYTETLTELKYQEKQNVSALQMLQDELFKNRAKFTRISEELMMLQNELRVISTHSNERELVIEEYTKKISFVESEVRAENKKIPLILELDECKKNIVRLSGEIAKLNLEIDDLLIRNQTRYNTVMSSLGKTATKFLENGTGNEEDFKTATAKTVEIDFEKDRWLLGGRVAFSESSNAEKKSALHISFLLQALQDGQTRYPLFSIMDFEVSDLNQERSQKLQNNILDLLKHRKGFQLLITSSKISKELNVEEYGVGPFYGKNDYIFKL